MKELEKISPELFNKIRSRFQNVSLGDENAKATTDPEKARFFKFEYCDHDGNELGDVTISLIDGNSLKLYFSKAMVTSMKPEQRSDWTKFLVNIRQFAKRNLINCDIRDSTQSNLDIRDIKQQAKTNGLQTIDDVNLGESRLWGTTRSSYQECGPVRIIVRHSGNVDETKRGARSRHIESIFLETAEGERRLLPFKNLTGARAMAQHYRHGGTLEDSIGESITAMCAEMSKMAHFCRHAKTRQFEDTETTNMAKAAVHHYDQVNRTLRQMRGARGYRSYFESWMPESAIEDEIDIDGLRERFAKKIYDDRFNDALPSVYRAYQRQQQQLETKLGDQFENWANDVSEMRLEEDLADQADEVEHLDKIMATPLKVGPRGMSAIGALTDIIDDRSLDDKFAELADTSGQDADAREIVAQWLLDNGYAELANKYQAAYTQQQTPATDPNQPPPQQPGVQAEVPAGSQTGSMGTADPSPQANTAQMAEDTDPLSLIRMLAGLSNH